MARANSQLTRPRDALPLEDRPGARLSDRPLGDVPPFDTFHQPFALTQRLALGRRALSVLRGGGAGDFATGPLGSEPLTALRRLLKGAGADALIVPSEDPHLSECVPDPANDLRARRTSVTFNSN